MRRLATFFVLLSLSSTALAGSASQAPAPPLNLVESAAQQLDPVTITADYSEAWRDFLNERRALQMERLTAYSTEGVFPVNTSIPGLANLFMDEEGRRCAMAHLIWEDGEENLVKVYAAVENGVRLGEVTEGPLLEWMLTSGLTQQEAAYIQVPDFQVNFELPELTQEQLIAQEQLRLRQHFAAATSQVELNTEWSLDAAVQRLGDRVHTPPPASPELGVGAA